MQRGSPKPKDFLQMLKETFGDWNKHKAPQLAAALSYYAIFSIAPLLVLAIGLAGLGVVSHLPLLYGDLTAGENLIFYGRMYSLANLEARVSEVLELVGLAQRRRDLVRTFSRGMQQRLAIGRAVLHDPEVMLLDEPYTGLDQDACDMLDAVLRQVAARGRTVVMTSHDLVRTADLASRFDVLSRGAIRASILSSALPQDGLLAFYREALQ